MSEERDFAPHDAAFLRRNRGYLAMGAAPIAVGLATVVGAIATGTAGFLAATPHLVLLGIISLAYVVQQNPAPIRAGGGVRVTAEGVWAEGELVARREDLKQGLVVPGDEGVTVRLQRRGKLLPLSIGVLDVATGERVLDALGLGAHQTAARVRILGAYADWSTAKQLAVFLVPMLVGAVVGLVGMALLRSPAPLLVLLLPLLLAILTGALAPRSLDIGAEGLRLRWLGREDFVRFADVRSIEGRDSTRGGKEFRLLEIEYRSGAKRELVIAQKGWEGGISAAVEERVRKAFDAFSAGEAAPDDAPPTALDRRERPLGEWITTLRRLGAGASAGPREATVPRETLMGIVEDPSRADLDRAAAAIAIGEGAGEEDRERVRIAARTSASPRLRIALERAADAEVEQVAIEEALDAVDQESAAKDAARR